MSDPANWQRPLIENCKRNVRELLEEVSSINDIDLWEIIDGALTDAMIVYRRSQSSLPHNPQRFRPDHGRVQLTEAQRTHMAWEMAMCKAFTEGRDEEAGW